MEIPKSTKLAIVGYLNKLKSERQSLKSKVINRFDRSLKTANNSNEYLISLLNQEILQINKSLADILSDNLQNWNVFSVNDLSKISNEEAIENFKFVFDQKLNFEEISELANTLSSTTTSDLESNDIKLLMETAIKTANQQFGIRVAHLEQRNFELQQQINEISQNFNQELNKRTEIIKAEFEQQFSKISENAIGAMSRQNSEISDKIEPNSPDRLGYNISIMMIWKSEIEKILIECENKKKFIQDPNDIQIQKLYSNVESINLDIISGYDIKAAWNLYSQLISRLPEQNLKLTDLKNYYNTQFSQYNDIKKRYEQLGDFNESLENLLPKLEAKIIELLKIVDLYENRNNTIINNAEILGKLLEEEPRIVSNEISYFNPQTKDLMIVKLKKGKTLKKTLNELPELMNLYTFMCVLPGERIFCFGNGKDNLSGIAFIIENDFSITMLPSGMPCWGSGGVYHDNLVYTFGGSNGMPLAFAEVFNFEYQKWEKKQNLPVSSEFCSCIYFKRCILLAGWKHTSLYKYDLFSDQYINLPLALTQDTTKMILKGFDRLFVLDGRYKMYESFSENEYDWNVLKTASGMEGENLLGSQAFDGVSFHILTLWRGYLSTSYGLHQFNLKNRTLDIKSIN